MKKHLLTAALGALSFFSAAAGNFNFPQEVDYAFGTMVSNRQSSTINTLYSSWKNKFYEESPDKTMARIKYDNTTLTVSEGIGYGMLIFVYMENAQNATQDEFNKLWAYYKRFGRFNGYLMDWKIEGFSNVATTDDCYNKNCSGSATDGDLDVAAALVLAHKQWGSNGTVNYSKEAENLLSYIYDKQVDGSKLFKPGDHWEGPYNPCYFTTASVKLFDIAQTQEAYTNTRDWATVYTKSQEFLAKAASPKGLYPDWCNASGDPYSGQGYYFSWDACRTPWRIAWDYSWFGNTTALSMSTLTADNFKSVGATSIKAKYDINTAVSNDNVNNTCFIGGIGAAFMTKSTYQSQLDEYYNHFLTKSETYGYYAPTLQVLYAIYFSGNAVNPYSLGGTVTAPEAKAALVDATTNGNILLTFSSEIAAFSGNPGFSVKVNNLAVSVSAATLQSNPRQVLISLPAGTITSGKTVSITYAGTALKGANGLSVAGFTTPAVNSLLDPNSKVIIDDCNDGDNTNELGGQWYTYNDNTDKGKSTVSPAAASFTMTGSGYGGTGKSAQITFTLDAGSCTYCPFVGLGFNLSEAGTAVDMTGTTGITFYHKGAGFTPEVSLTTIKNSQNFAGTAVPAHADWTLVTLEWKTLTQPDWGSNNVYVSWDLTKMNKIQFKVGGGATGTTLQIDNVESIGLFSVAPANKVPTVKTPIANITLEEGFQTKTVSIADVFTDADGDVLTITAATSSATVAAVAVSGSVLTITDKGSGKATITLTANDGSGGKAISSFTVTINAAPIVPESISLSASSLNMIADQQQTLQATISPAGAPGALVWTTSNASVATVTDGIVVAKGVGTATVTVSVSGTSISETITVNVASTAELPTDITLSASALTLLAGGSSQVIATAVPADATTPKYIWTSSNATVATVDQFGSITGVKAGSAVIKVTTTGANGQISKSITVTVTGGVSDSTLTGSASAEVFPLPLQDILYIKSEEKVEQVDIFTIDGKKCLSQKYTEYGIDVQPLPLGAFTMVITYISGAQQTVPLQK